MPVSYNSDHKVVIRRDWNKPILKWLRKKTGKLVYLGLPSPAAEDVEEWLEYLSIIIAFQYPEEEGDPIGDLRKKLMKLEREKSIDTFYLYEDYIERVVIRGKDSKGTKFGLSKYVTLYNLDFCNNISYPIDYFDENDKPQTAYKFDAITRLMEIQKGIEGDRFVLFITLQCSYDRKELEPFIRHPENQELREYLPKCNDLSRRLKNACVVRAFVAHRIREKFRNNGFIPYIDPTILYRGKNDIELLHFTVFGTRSSLTASGPPSPQTLESILSQKFITIDEGGFVNFESILDGEADVNDPNPLVNFFASETFQSYWNASNSTRRTELQE